MRPALLAALVLAALTGCAGSDRSPPGPPGPERAERRVERLPARLAGLERLCTQATSYTVVAVHCPSWLPPGAWGGRAFRKGRCDYLFDINSRPLPRSASTERREPFEVGDPYHVFVGGRCGSFSLRAENGRWPVRARRVRDLGLIGSRSLQPGQRRRYPLPERLRVLRRTEVSGDPALLLLAEQFPDGGVHGGHIAAVWNQGGAGYALSVHFDDEGTAGARRQRIVLRAAASMSRYVAGSKR